ncbi:unnamed protein product, partial [Symbiodinium necroappetens]
ELFCDLTGVQASQAEVEVRCVTFLHHSAGRSSACSEALGRGIASNGTQEMELVSACERAATVQSTTDAVASHETQCKSVKARRLAAMTWLVTYQVLISFEPFSVSRVVVDSALRPSCEHGSILAMLGTEETLLVCQGCSSGVEPSTATRWTYLCSLEYFGNVPQPRVSAGSTSIEVPVDHPLGNFTHLAIFTQSVVASVSSVAFPDEDLDAAEIGGKIRWVATAAKSERVL